MYAWIWEKTTAKHAKWLGTLTADQIPSDRKWFEKKGKELTNDIPEAPAEYRIGFAVHVLTCAVGAALVRQGWGIETAPGKPILVVKDGARFNPRESITKLADGSIGADDWKATCASMAISTMR